MGERKLMGLGLARWNDDVDTFVDISSKEYPYETRMDVLRQLRAVTWNFWNIRQKPGRIILAGDRDTGQVMFWLRAHPTKDKMEVITREEARNILNTGSVAYGE